MDVYLTALRNAAALHKGCRIPSILPRPSDLHDTLTDQVRELIQYQLAHDLRAARSVQSHDSKLPDQVNSLGRKRD